jgi:glycosyltransferase involved in cell wall biosynthesis
MNIEISVIICTYGRSKYLHTAIESVINQKISPEIYEIIIVDGDNKRDSESLIKEFNKFPNFQYITEPRPGLSVARNAGCRFSKGTFIAFMDDDAIADSDWLKNILNTFLNNPDKVEAVGGKIEPIWEIKSPIWLSDELLPVLSILDIGNSTMTLNPHQFLFGTNMAFRKSVLIKFNGFNQNLGREGKNLLSNEEIYLQKKITESGGLRIFDPDIKIKHNVPKERLTKEWFIQRYYWQGISDSVMQIIEEKPSKLRRISHTFLKIAGLLHSPKDLKWLLITSDSPKEFAGKCITYCKLGQISGLFRRVRF